MPFRRKQNQGETNMNDETERAIADAERRGHDLGLKDAAHIVTNTPRVAILGDTGEVRISTYDNGKLVAQSPYKTEEPALSELDDAKLINMVRLIPSYVASPHGPVTHSATKIASELHNRLRDARLDRDALLRFLDDLLTLNPAMSAFFSRSRHQTVWLGDPSSEPAMCIEDWDLKGVHSAVEYQRAQSEYKAYADVLDLSEDAGERDAA